MADLRHYEVWRDGHAVLSFSTRPGHVGSTAIAPPGFSPTTHPFLTARAHDAFYEGELAELMRQAESVDDFISRLERAGFEVRPESVQDR